MSQCVVASTRQLAACLNAIRAVVATHDAFVAGLGRMNGIDTIRLVKLSSIADTVIQFAQYFRENRLRPVSALLQHF